MEEHIIRSLQQMVCVFGFVTGNDLVCVGVAYFLTGSEVVLWNLTAANDTVSGEIDSFSFSPPSLTNCMLWTSKIVCIDSYTDPWKILVVDTVGSHTVQSYNISKSVISGFEKPNPFESFRWTLDSNRGILYLIVGSGTWEYFPIPIFVC
jgi:hypothetical protein